MYTLVRDAERICAAVRIHSKKEDSELSALSATLSGSGAGRPLSPVAPRGARRCGRGERRREMPRCHLRDLARATPLICAISRIMTEGSEGLEKGRQAW